LFGEVYGKAAVKKTQVYKCYRRFLDTHMSVSDDPRCRLEVFFDAQDLVRCEFIPEGCPVNKECMSKSSVTSGDAVETSGKMGLKPRGEKVHGHSSRTNYTG
jgi:hypothetical protein